MIISIPDEYLNDAQIESAIKLIECAAGAHDINITVRKDGQEWLFEADFLRHGTVTGDNSG